MLVDGLTIPSLLVEAVGAGRWPHSTDEANRQHLHSVVPEERVRGLAANESEIYLYPPPFHTVSSVLGGTAGDFYRRFGALDQLVPKAAIEIADFGLGSDAPILLDYRASRTDPRVIRLSWSGNSRPNEWVLVAVDFPSFMKALGL